MPSWKRFLDMFTREYEQQLCPCDFVLWVHYSSARGVILIISCLRITGFVARRICHNNVYVSARQLKDSQLEAINDCMLDTAITCSAWYKTLIIFNPFMAFVSLCLKDKSLHYIQWRTEEFCSNTKDLQWWNFHADDFSILIFFDR